MQNIYTPLGDALTDATRRSFSIGFGMERTGGRALFDVKDTNGKLVEVFNSGVMDNMAHSTLDGGNFYENESIYGDELTITQGKFTSSTEITTGLAELYDQYNVAEVLEGSEGLGLNHANRIEMDIQQIVKNGATGSFTNVDGDVVVVQSADAVSLFSNSHTVNGSSAVYDNLDATSFGQTGLEALGNLARNGLNHEGQRSNKKMNVIFSTTEVGNTELIKEYRNSTGHVEDPARGINTWQGRYDHIALEYLDTDTSGAPDSTTNGYWGIALKGAKDLKLRVGERPRVLDPKKRNAAITFCSKPRIGMQRALKTPTVSISPRPNPLLPCPQHETSALALWLARPSLAPLQEG